MADFRITEISVTTGAGSLAVADVTCYAEPANTGSLAVVEVSCTATPASTVASFVYTGSEWVRGVPHIYTGGVWQAL